MKKKKWNNNRIWNLAKQLAKGKHPDGKGKGALVFKKPPKKSEWGDYLDIEAHAYPFPKEENWEKKWQTEAEITMQLQDMTGNRDIMFSIC